MYHVHAIGVNAAVILSFLYFVFFSSFSFFILYVVVIKYGFMHLTILLKLKKKKKKKKKKYITVILNSFMLPNLKCQ